MGRKHSIWRGWVFISVTLIFGWGLTGCGGQVPATPELVEMKSSWCSSPADYKREITELQEYAAGITVEACFQGGKDQYQIESYGLEKGDYKLATGKPSPVSINNLFAYIKVKEKVAGREEYQEVSKFEIPLEIRVVFTAEAWADMQAGGNPLPRAAYLTRSAAGWAESWVEIDPHSLQVTLPDQKDPGSEGFLYLRFDELPDPLIGGC